MNIRSDLRMEKSQFFPWLERQARRHELANGRAIMLPFVTRNHALVCTNVVLALAARLDRSRFNIVQGDFAVETGNRSVRFADVMVETAGGEGQARSTAQALLLVEVLSPSTMHVDFGEKHDEYKALPTLGAYLVLSQDEARAWAWTRVAGAWPDGPTMNEGLDAWIDVPALATSLPLAEFYSGVKLR